MKELGQEQPRIRSGEAGESRIEAEALFREHSVFVARFLRHIGVPVADLDDVVQEVFLVAHKKGGYVSGPGQPRTWLAAIAIRLQRSRLRGRILRQRQLDALALDAMNLGAQETGDASERLMSAEFVQRALDSLDLDHRATFVLYEIEGKPCEDIARALGVPVGTVYSRLYHARRKFLREYAALGAEPAEPALLPRRYVAEGA
jgi:RNA polymerase sigma-70 factor (ECF subfamily)